MAQSWIVGVLLRGDRRSKHLDLLGSGLDERLVVEPVALHRGVFLVELHIVAVGAPRRLVDLHLRLRRAERGLVGFLGKQRFELDVDSLVSGSASRSPGSFGWLSRGAWSRAWRAPALRGSDRRGRRGSSWVTDHPGKARRVTSLLGLRPEPGSTRGTSPPAAPRGAPGSGAERAARPRGPRPDGARRPAPENALRPAPENALRLAPECALRPAPDPRPSVRPAASGAPPNQTFRAAQTARR